MELLRWLQIRHLNIFGEQALTTVISGPLRKAERKALQNFGKQERFQLPIKITDSRMVYCGAINEKLFGASHSINLYNTTLVSVPSLLPCHLISSSCMRPVIKLIP